MYCAAAGLASKKATAASRDKPNNKGRRENAGPIAAPFMPGLPFRAAIRLLHQIRSKSPNNIPCRRLLCNIPDSKSGRFKEPHPARGDKSDESDPLDEPSTLEGMGWFARLGIFWVKSRIGVAAQGRQYALRSFLGISIAAMLAGANSSGRIGRSRTFPHVRELSANKDRRRVRAGARPRDAQQPRHLHDPPTRPRDQRTPRKLP